MRYLTLFLLSFVFLAAEEANPTPQPPEVIKALAAYEKAVIAGRKLYDATEIKAKQAAFEALEKAKKAFIKAGDLEGANMVAVALKNLESGSTLAEVEENLRRQTLFAVDPRAKLVGKWHVFNTNGWGDDMVINERFEAEIVGNSHGTLDLNRDGSMTVNLVNSHKFTNLVSDLIGKGYVGNNTGPGVGAGVKVYLKK